MYFGWADPALNPLMGIDYYERVAKETGPAVTDSFRLFMVPGMFHCSGGVGPDQFDGLGTLVRWVEQGTPPDRIIATQHRSGQAIRTRPLCPYPQEAVYQGTGDPNQASSFRCGTKLSP